VLSSAPRRRLRRFPCVLIQRQRPFDQGEGFEACADAEFFRAIRASGTSARFTRRDARRIHRSRSLPVLEGHLKQRPATWAATWFLSWKVGATLELRRMRAPDWRPSHRNLVEEQAARRPGARSCIGVDLQAAPGCGRMLGGATEASAQIQAGLSRSPNALPQCSPTAGGRFC